MKVAETVHSVSAKCRLWHSWFCPAVYISCVACEIHIDSELHCCDTVLFPDCGVGLGLGPSPVQPGISLSDVNVKYVRRALRLDVTRFLRFICLSPISPSPRAKPRAGALGDARRDIPGRRPTVLYQATCRLALRARNLQCLKIMFLRLKF